MEWHCLTFKCLLKALCKKVGTKTSPVICFREYVPSCAWLFPLLLSRICFNLSSKDAGLWVISESVLDANSHGSSYTYMLYLHVHVHKSTMQAMMSWTLFNPITPAKSLAKKILLFCLKRTPQKCPNVHCVCVCPYESVTNSAGKKFFFVCIMVLFAIAGVQ